MAVDQATLESVSKLTNKAKKCFQKGNFVTAVRNLINAISIYKAYTPLHKMLDQDKTKIVKLYGKRAHNLKYGKEKRSLTIIQKVNFIFK